MNKGTPMNTSTESVSSSPLISVQDLAARLEGPAPRVFDVRGKWGSPPLALHDDYLASHIPGAAFLDWTAEFLRRDLPLGLAPVATAEQAARSFERLGISSGDHVVLYDDYHHMIAGRVWWAMRYHGFHNVQVLNGGWRHWTQRDLPTTKELPRAVAGTFRPAVQANLRIDTAGVAARRGTACLIDARGATGFAGNPDDPRCGHIPGSINLPFSALLSEDTGLFLTDDALTAVFDRAAPNWRTDQIISSCGSGYAATVVMLALAHLGAHPGVASTLYDGSMAEWKQDPSREIAQSPPRG